MQVFQCDGKIYEDIEIQCTEGNHNVRDCIVNTVKSIVGKYEQEGWKVDGKLAIRVKYKAANGREGSFETCYLLYTVLHHLILDSVINFQLYQHSLLCDSQLQFVSFERSGKLHLTRNASN